MAEEDVMLVAIRMDAKGAIKDTAVLDNKFQSLGKTFKNAKKPMDDITESQNKLDTAVKKTTGSTVEANVQSISTLAAMEALTSGMNQWISAKYKRIDADLAAGKISQEQAEAKRKEIKQQEKYTGMLEQSIAVIRLATVVQMVYRAVMGATTKTTDAATLSTRAFNFALKQNPIVLIITSLIILVAYMAAMERIFGKTSKTIDTVTDSFKKLRDMWSGLLQLANPFDNLLGSERFMGSGNNIRMMGG